jgi:hypothetical protein
MPLPGAAVLAMTLLGAVLAMTLLGAVLAMALLGVVLATVTRGVFSMMFSPSLVGLAWTSLTLHPKQQYHERFTPILVNKSD